MKIKNIDPLGRALEVPSLGLYAAHGETVDVGAEQAPALLGSASWAEDDKTITKGAKPAESKE